MKRLVTFVTCGLIFVFLAAQFNFSFGAQPVSVKFTFAAPHKNQTLKAGQPFTCKGSFKFTPANKSLSGVHIWLFQANEQLSNYFIQKPINLSSNGTWQGSILPNKDTKKVLAVLADDPTDRLFVSWLKRGLIGKQYELPRGAKILTEVSLK